MADRRPQQQMEQQPVEQVPAPVQAKGNRTAQDGIERAEGQRQREDEAGGGDAPCRDAISAQPRRQRDAEEADQEAGIADRAAHAGRQQRREAGGQAEAGGEEENRPERRAQRRQPEEAVECQAEIAEREELDRHDIGQQGPALRHSVEQEGADPDEPDQRRQSLGGPVATPLPAQQQPCRQRREQEGGIADRIERLGPEGAAQPLAIARALHALTPHLSESPNHVAGLMRAHDAAGQTGAILRESDHGEQAVTQPFGPTTNVAAQRAWRIAPVLRRFPAEFERGPVRAGQRLKIRPNFHCSDKIVKRSARVWRRFQTIS
jgi:hypothetical protein